MGEVLAFPFSKAGRYHGLESLVPVTSTDERFHSWWTAIRYKAELERLD